MQHSEHDFPLPERVAEELDTLLAGRVHPDDTPVDEDARRARALEWAVRAEQRHRFAAEHAGAAPCHSAPPPSAPTSSDPPHAAA